MPAQWHVKVTAHMHYGHERLNFTIFALSREEAKDEAVRQATMFMMRQKPQRVTVDHVACNGPHPRPFNKSERGRQRREERRFTLHNKGVIRDQLDSRQ